MQAIVDDIVKNKLVKKVKVTRRDGEESHEADGNHAAPAEPDHSLDSVIQGVQKNQEAAALREKEAEVKRTETMRTRAKV